MNIQILAIDKLKKTDPEQLLISEYLKKTRWPIEVREFEEKRALSDIQKKEAESLLLLNAVQKNAKRASKAPVSLNHSIRLGIRRGRT